MAGSRRGRPNKATKAREEIISKQGLTPLAFLLDVLRNEDNEHAVRMDAAKAAAPYVHPRLSQIDANVRAQFDLIGFLRDAT